MRCLGGKRTVPGSSDVATCVANSNAHWKPRNHGSSGLYYMGCRHLAKSFPTTNTSPGIPRWRSCPVGERVRTQLHFPRNQVEAKQTMSLPIVFELIRDNL